MPDPRAEPSTTPRGRRMPADRPARPGPRRRQGERVSLGDMVDAFDARAYGPLIVLFAAPNVLPVALPGISAVLGAPLILLTGQMMIGRHRPWLPRAPAPPLAGARHLRGAGRAHRAAARRASRRMIRPRLLPLTSAAGKRLIGAVGMLLAAIVFLPVPFGNSLPGLALVLMAVGPPGPRRPRGGGRRPVGVAGLVVVSGFSTARWPRPCTSRAAASGSDRAVPATNGRRPVHVRCTPCTPLRRLSPCRRRCLRDKDRNAKAPARGARSSLA